eukprot:TRINITY_DN5841_c0_g1_i2.p1 TRINITY_DN5841_c0_g1~~TRINITY_DN5841_c0_g1_i2.p1  ORF type:complete len:562 (-),score=97.94 TRINITY_DN5841_c0_g1_i2:163-1809(-)
MNTWAVISVTAAIISLTKAAAGLGIVNTDCGAVQGSERLPGLWHFLGIPYAAPPVGPRRWQPPTSLPDSGLCWNGTLDASKYGAICPQMADAETVIGDEDCLFINVWTTNLPQANRAAQPAPVMLYIHGGSLVLGCGNLPTETPWRIAAENGIVSVSLNYRLNVFGFLALSELSSNDPRGVSGNYGFLDQMLALKWIQRNIAAFGGDPSRVTVWGQSSGGTSVLALLASPSANGLFHRAISMSGSPNISVPLHVAESIHVDDFVANSPCAGKSSKALLDCLYGLDLYGVMLNRPTSWNPDWLMDLPTPGSIISPLAIVDGVTVTKEVRASLLAGVNDVPLILGTMHEEPDIEPVVDVRNLTVAEYEAYLQKRFSPWGADFYQQVLALYPTASFDGVQQSYDSISADIGVICGNLQLAQSASDGFKSSVFMYITRQRPEVPECFFSGFTYCSTYSYHTFDLDCLSNDFGYLLPLLPEDVAFGDYLRGVFAEFASTGRIQDSAWKDFNASGSEQYVVTELLTNSSIWPMAKKSQCDFWHSQGFDVFWWQN